MGRPKKPTHLKIVAGTDRPDRTNKAEPKPQRSIPSPPAHLSDRAKTAWGALAVILDDMKVLTKADGFALEGLCESYSDLLAARESLAAPLLLTIRDKDGNEFVQQLAAAGERSYWTGGLRRARPELGVIADTDRRFQAWLAKFGLSPADRARVSARMPGAGGNFDDF